MVPVRLLHLLPSRFSWGLRAHLVRAPWAPAAPSHRTISQTFKAPSSTSNDTADAPTPGVIARVLQRVLALTGAIWHDRATGQPVARCPTAYDS